MLSVAIGTVLASIWLGVAAFELRYTWRLERGKPIGHRALLAVGALLWPLGLLTLLWPARFTGRGLH